MVSMTAAESLVASLWPDARHAVVSVPDPRKGEALLLVTTQKGAEPRDLLAFARQRGVPELMVPRSMQTVGTVPLLATGKVDYPAVEKMVREARAEAVPEEATV
jgi:acyl-[acyl-carrier-protein]-phospholipid O-acyltransferase / long-chain-fatty-acid--[acyl-carrier-protein] ligase